MKFIPAALLILFSSAVWAEGFDSVVDFGIELSSLDDPKIVAEAVEDGRIVILEGLIGDSEIDSSGDVSRVWVTLVGGAWIGTDEVRSYSCMILFEGEKWLDVFPDAKPQNPADNYVPQGSRLLVAVKLLGINEEIGIPTAEMVDYRVLH